MPPKKVIEPEIVPVVEDRLETRIAVLEHMVEKLYKAHYNPIYG